MGFEFKSLDDNICIILLDWLLSSNNVCFYVWRQGRLSSLTIGAVSEVSDPRLGLPNPTFECPTCGAKTFRGCEGFESKC